MISQPQIDMTPLSKEKTKWVLIQETRRTKIVVKEKTGHSMLKGTFDNLKNSK